MPHPIRAPPSRPNTHHASALGSAPRPMGSKPRSPGSWPLSQAGGAAPVCGREGREEGVSVTTETKKKTHRNTQPALGAPQPRPQSSHTASTGAVGDVDGGGGGGADGGDGRKSNPTPPIKPRDIGPRPTAPAASAPLPPTPTMLTPRSSHTRTREPQGAVGSARRDGALGGDWAEGRLVGKGGGHWEGEEKGGGESVCVCVFRGA